MKLRLQSRRHRLFAFLAGVTMVAIAALGQATSWLDRPLTGWNKPGEAIPSPPSGAETRETLSRRCAAGVSKVQTAQGPATSALIKAGWTPFLHLDQQTQRGDVYVAGGMSAAGLGCDATTFNVFVFVGGAFAGTLAPAPMTAAHDGVIGPVRITGTDALTAEFARYKPADLECCPSGRVRVSYKIERAGGRPAVVATEVKTIR